MHRNWKSPTLTLYEKPKEDKSDTKNGKKPACPLKDVDNIHSG